MDNIIGRLERDYARNIISAAAFWIALARAGLILIGRPMNDAHINLYVLRNDSFTNFNHRRRIDIQMILLTRKRRILSKYIGETVCLGSYDYWWWNGTHHIEMTHKNCIDSGAMTAMEFYNLRNSCRKVCFN